MTDSTPDTAATLDGPTLERIMHAALAAGDVKGVHAALSVMATTDPRRAERLLGTLQEALAVARIVTGECDRPVSRETVTCPHDRQGP